ncbi:protein IWS1 homolog [Tripterygium wilfordii]|uniref:protein IWS1 homolog n=1 Tax=Tripterygium wilfordii TaxID=458696 RepID=UPI0018F82310|nr:protein IWS1 homolog [Tripterygium wilfordii]
MGNRRFAQVSTSDEEEEGPRTRSSRAQTESRKRKKVKLSEDEEEVESEQAKSSNKKRKTKNTREEEPPSDGEDEEEEDEPPPEDAKPVGESVRLSGKGRGRRRHYEAFEFDGNRYDLEDPVLLVPEDKDQKPYVAIIKDISQTKDGSMMVTGQWFYRPEEAEKKGGGSWQSRDSRELFYSFHQDEVPAESVMHKCVVHFVPINKQLPSRKQHPGFIVQKVYDIQNRKLWKLTDQDYEDNKQHEIDILVDKTLSRLGELLDLDTEEIVAEQEEQLKIKKTLRKKNISPLDVSREEEATAKPDQQFKAETPGSCSSNASEYYSILLKFNALTGDTHRDKCLERLLQGIQYMCTSENLCADENGKGGPHGIVLEKDPKNLENAIGSLEKNQRSGKPFVWPDAAFPAITALEEASHEALSSDFQKYNQKMRQLVFNLRNTSLLARRLLNRELEPSKILSMSPNELKEGLTAEEIATKEPEESERMQMTDARCSRCSEFKVGLRDIIQAGHGDRYQLECIACGHSWYASRDEASTLTIDGPSSAKSVGTAPWATSKFATIASPRESDKAPNDPSKKNGDAAMPVLDTQRSFSKSKNENEKTTKNT